MHSCNAATVAGANLSTRLASDSELILRQAR
jgi:hypothetical protein